MFDGFLLKPVSVEDLDEALTRALGNEAGSAGQGMPGSSRKITEPPRPADLTSELGERLREEIAALGGRLEAAVAADDRPRVLELAHDIKGLCGYFGLREMEAAVRELEVAAPREDPGALRARLEGLKGLGHPQASVAPPQADES